MNQFDTVQIIALLGWLVLAGSAFASFRMSWRKGLSMALVWCALFGAVFLLFFLVRRG